jgi:UDP-glucuronate 4-epimerase
VSVLVTGASGVVGVHVARALAERGEHVVAFSKSGRTPVTDSLLQSVAGELTYQRGDVRDAEAVARVVGDHEVTAIVHAAGLTGEAQARARTLDVIAVNVMGTANVLEAARQHGVRRLVYLGSSAEYGRRPDLEPIGEEDADPEGMYAETKHLGFRLVRRYRTLFDIEAVTCRVNSVYGPGTRFNPYRGLVGNTLVAHLCRAAARGEPVHLEGGGDYPRGWTHAADVAEGIRLIIAHDAPPHDVYNLASGRLSTVREVVDALLRVAPSAEITVGDGAWDDDPFQAANLRGPLDITRARRDLGFAPAVVLEDGLAAYVEWWRRMPDSG